MHICLAQAPKVEYNPSCRGLPVIDKISLVKHARVLSVFAHWPVLLCPPLPALPCLLSTKNKAREPCSHDDCFFSLSGLSRPYSALPFLHSLFCLLSTKSKLVNHVRMLVVFSHCLSCSDLPSPSCLLSTRNKVREPCSPVAYVCPLACRALPSFPCLACSQHKQGS